MRDLLSRLPLLIAAQIALVATIVLTALAASSRNDLIHVARPARWPVLGALCALSLLLAARERTRRGPPNLLLGVAGAFLVLAFASVTWSVMPRLTFERAVSLAMLLAAAAALAWASAGNRRLLDGILLAVLAGAALVCFGGLLLLAVDPGQAAQLATSQDPFRFSGLARSPNTVSALAAVALPLAAWFSLAGAGWRRALGLAALGLLLFTVVASGSRGALLSALAGMLLFSLAVREAWLRRAGLAAATAALLVGGSALNELVNPPPPPSAAEASAVATGARSAAAEVARLRGGARGTVVKPTQAELERLRLLTVTAPGSMGLPRMEDELGYPTLLRRHVLGSSGRSAAWHEALREWRRRPLLGYGLGTEEFVFVDRFYTFQGYRPENSYLGLLLQLGLAGLALFLALGLALLGTLLRALRRPGTERWPVAACAGVALGGFVLGLFQSYVYSVGNIATVTFWICAFMLPAAAALRKVTGSRCGAARPAPAADPKGTLAPA